MKINLKKLKKQGWYLQETDSNPFFTYQPALSCLRLFKTTDQVFFFVGTHNCKLFFSKDFLRKKAEYYIKKEKAHFGYLKKLYKHWIKQILQKNEQLFEKLNGLEIQNINDLELLKLNQKIVRYTQRMWSCFFMDFFDLDAEMIIEREMINANLILSTNEKNIFTMQFLPLAHQCQEYGLLKIAKLIKENSKARTDLFSTTNSTSIHNLKGSPKIYNEILKHQRDYFWIYNSYSLITPYSILDIVENLKNIIKSSKNLDLEIKKFNNLSKDLNQQKLAIAKKYHISAWLKQMFNFFSILSYWRDLRKVQVQKINYYLQLIGSEIARRSNLKWEDVKICDPDAINKLPWTIKSAKHYRNLFTNESLLFWDGKQVKRFKKNQAKKIVIAIEKIINKPTSEIRGMIASPGKIRGEVVVIRRESEFYKMKVGAILVAPMTRPEYVPLMKKAAAIITDEGGITSHAAVVSRELGVPCVIGTQTATKVLKDGDRVFVNADHGVITLE